MDGLVCIGFVLVVLAVIGFFLFCFTKIFKRESGAHKNKKEANASTPVQKQKNEPKSSSENNILGVKWKKYIINAMLVVIILLIAGVFLAGIPAMIAGYKTGAAMSNANIVLNPEQQQVLTDLETHKAGIAADSVLCSQYVNLTNADADNWNNVKAASAAERVAAYNAYYRDVTYETNQLESYNTKLDNYNIW